MFEDQGSKTTVQGFGTPVPATGGSEQAGSQSSRPNYCNDTVVANLATVSDRASSENIKMKGNGQHAVMTSGSIVFNVSDTISPFSKSGKIVRSPIKEAHGGISKRPRSSPPALNGSLLDEQQLHKRQCGSKRSNTCVEGQERNTLTNFQKLGAQIRTLVEMLEDGKRRSIHQPMRDTIESIKNLYILSETESHVAAKQVIRKTNFSQTSPLEKPLENPQKSQETKRIHNRETPKCHPIIRTLTPGESKGLTRESNGTNTQLPIPGKPKAKEKNDVHVISYDSGTNTNEASNVLPLTSNAEVWQTVRRKNKRKRKKTPLQVEAQTSRPKRKVSRPDAIIITKTSENSYADILKQMKASPELHELGEQVNKIRKTAKGELLLELKRVNNEQHSKLRQHAEQALANLANVRTVSQEILIECRDIDEVTTREEICTAIQNQFTTTGTVNSSAIKSLRPTRYGTQTALISLPARLAQTIIKLADYSNALLQVS